MLYPTVIVSMVLPEANMNLSKDNSTIFSVHPCVKGYDLTIIIYSTLGHHLSQRLEDISLPRDGSSAFLPSLVSPPSRQMETDKRQAWTFLSLRASHNGILD